MTTLATTTIQGIETLIVKEPGRSIQFTPCADGTEEWAAECWSIGEVCQTAFEQEQKAATLDRWPGQTARSAQTWCVDPQAVPAPTLNGENKSQKSTWKPNLTAWITTTLALALLATCALIGWHR